MRRCQPRAPSVGFGMHTDFLDSVPRRRSSASSATRRPASCLSSGGQKNGLWRVWPRPARLVRPQGAADPRSLLWRHARLPRRRSPARGLPGVRRGEAGTARVPRRQPVLHEALWLLRRPALPGLLDPRGGQGAAARLAKRQGHGDAVHGRAAAPLPLDGRRALKTLLAANKRLNTAYVLKESFGQLWEYEREGWARRFFDHWRAALKWQRLGPYEKFAAMIARHWDGIAAYCHPQNKVALGFVEGLNNKIRVLQRRAYGLRDEEYLRLKILTCMLPAI